MFYENTYTGNKLTISSQGEYFIGRSDLDPSLGRTSEQQAFVIAIKALESPENARRILLSQPDSQALLENND